MNNEERMNKIYEILNNKSIKSSNLYDHKSSLEAPSFKEFHETKNKPPKKTHPHPKIK